MSTGRAGDSPAWPGLLLYALVSVLWSWPLALAPASSTTALHFDGFPMAWLAEAAPSFLPDGTSDWSAWPEGEPLQRIDSFLFLGVALATGGAIPGMLLVNLFVLVGPVLSAWAAERFARRALGVEGPAALVAGLCFGFAPIGLVAALEGHVYTLLDPWVPLCALACWEGRARGAALHFALALLSTAYLGVAALVLAGAIALARGPALGRATLARVLGGMGAVGAAYTALYLTGDGGPAREAGDAALRAGSATLTTAVAWSPWVDMARHSLGPVLGVLPLCVGGLALAWGLPRERRLLGIAGLLAAVGTLGPWLELGVARTEQLPGPLAWLESSGLFEVYRFPARLAWVSALSLGALASVAVARGSRRVQLAFVGAAVLDVLVASGAAFRMRGHPTPVPSLYALLPRAPVLELTPEPGGEQEDLGFFQQNLSCHAQLFHRRPILDRCLNTDLRRSGRRAAARAVHAALLAGEPALPILAGLEVGSVVLHADLYAAPERAELVRGLDAELGARIGEGRDGGEWLIAWKVEGGSDG